MLGIIFQPMVSNSIVPSQWDSLGQIVVSSLGASHSQPGLLGLCGAQLSQLYVICIPSVQTPVALVVALQVHTGFASSQGQLLQMIEFSQDKVSRGHIYDDRW